PAQRTDLDLPHVRDVEQTSGSTDVQMLLQYSGSVLDRHFVAGEWNHTCTELDMQPVQRRDFQGGNRRDDTHDRTRGTRSIALFALFGARAKRPTLDVKTGMRGILDSA